MAKRIYRAPIVEGVKLAVPLDDVDKAIAEFETKLATEAATLLGKPRWADFDLYLDIPSEKEILQKVEAELPTLWPGRQWELQLSYSDIPREFRVIALWVKEWENGDRQMQDTAGRKVIVPALKLPDGATIAIKRPEHARPRQHANYALVWKASELLEHMKGKEEEVKWGNYHSHNVAARHRAPSEISIFTEFVLKCIDPQRSPPKLSFYPTVGRDREKAKQESAKLPAGD